MSAEATVIARPVSVGDALLSVRGAGELLAIDGRPASQRRVRAWMQEGARAADGAVVRLASRRAPRGIVTSREAVEAFLERLGRGDAVCAGPKRLDQTDRGAALLARLARHGVSVGGRIDAVA